MKRTAAVLRAAAVLLAAAGLATTAAAGENRQLAFEDEAPAAEGEVAAPAAKQEEVAPPPPAAVVHPPSDNAIKHDQGREEDWGLRQREAERARQESRERAGRRLGYEDVESSTGVRHGGDSGALSDQIQRLGAAVSVQGDPCPCPYEAFAVMDSDAGSDGGGGASDISGDSVFEIGDVGGGGGGLDRSEEGHLLDLEARRAELEKELAKRRNDFLDSEEGKKTKDKLDEIEKERQKKLQEAMEEYAKRGREARFRCCTDGRQGDLAGWWLRRQAEIDEEAERKREEAIDEGMEEAGHDGQGEYQDARDEHNEVDNEIRGIKQNRARQIKESRGSR